jgi:uncharacterized protein (DUF2236 family)
VTPTLVTREELERSLAILRDEIADPRHGIHGPGSMSWQIDREMAIFLAGGRAALLQLAHPAVAHAVDQHSHTRADPLGRFQRTFEQVFAMVFGDLDHAVAAARRVHAIHTRIFGSGDGAPYHANEANALMWVHATLVDSAVLAFELFVRELRPDELARFYAESHRFARLFGIPEACIPPDWGAFQRYCQRMFGALEVCAPAREMAGFLLTTPPPRGTGLQSAARIVGAAAGAYRVLTLGLLPPPIRRQFGFPYRASEARAFGAACRVVRVAYRALPSRARHVPAYADALRRVAGKPGRDPFGAWLERRLIEPGAALMRREG